MADESLGAARIDVIVGTASMDVGLDAAKNKMAGLGAAAEAQFTKASSSSKRYAESLLRQAEMLGKTRAEQIAYNAQTRIGGELGDKIAAQALANQVKMSASASHIAGEATKAFSGTNKSARELQFAMRGLPAQFTDIFTSLASGQRPMMVLLQQGGQIKDLFGGIVPALRAVGNGIMAMINPFTITAGAVAALGFAWKQAEEDASAFNKALLVTGNYAGKTSMQLESMVGAIASTANTTQGAAREALQKVAETGRFTGAQFDLVATAAARMESATGQSIDSTIKKFEELAKSPVDALLKLNETEHFLTDAQLERVRALMAEGKEQEAAAEAARIYAGRLDEVGAAAEAARPHLANMWKEAKEGASSAWEETKRFTEFLAAAADKYKEMPWYKKMTPVGVIGSLYGAEPTAPASIASVSGAIDSNQAKAAIKLQEDAAKFKDRYLTREQEKTRELADLDKLRAQYSEQEYQSLRKQIELKYADKGAAKSAAKSVDFWNAPIVDAGLDATKDSAKFVEGLKAQLGQQSKNTVGLMQYTAAMDARIKTDREAAELQIESLGLGQHQIELRQKIIAIERDSNRDLEKLNKEFADKSFHMTQDDYDARLKVIKDKEAERVQIVTETDRKLTAAMGDASTGAKAALADFEYSAQNVASATYSVVTDIYTGLANNMADFFTKGKADWKGFVADILKEIVKIQTAKAVAGIATSLSSSFGFQGGTSASTFAKGGVFDSPGLSAYSGGVYSSPQPFKFANGAGVFGEAGPEAIMPLRRGADGKLGVAASGGGGGVVVNQVINVDSSGNASEQTSGGNDDALRQFAGKMKSVAQQTILDEQRPGGSLWRMRQSA